MLGSGEGLFRREPCRWCARVLTGLCPLPCGVFHPAAGKERMEEGKKVGKNEEKYFVKTETLYCNMYV